MSEVVQERLLGDILIARGAVTAGGIAEALEVQRADGEHRRLGELLVGLGHCRAGDVAVALSEQYGLPLRNLRDLELDAAVMRLVPPDLAWRHQVLPLEATADHLVVAIGDPLNIEALDDLRFATSRRIEPVVADAEAIRQLVEEHYLHQMMTTASSDAVEVLADDDEDIGDVQSMAREALVVRLVNLLLRQAISERASDIHIEPFERDLKVRFRIDGVLRDMPAPAKRYQAAITSRIKILAELDIAERRLPQDGRIKVRVEGREIDLRISTVPTLYGESVVMRLLDKETGLRGLDDLGFPAHTRERFQRLLKTPYGIILATGPTGSGKTTTLYAALQLVNSPTRKVITIEDPVEYQLGGVNQIHVRPKIGLTFAEGLRHILRQDPDVIMVGEIRDGETADIAIHAALTGHLVFSTLHTNDSSSAMARLLDMGAEPFLVASSVEGVLAQRLVRRLCPHCRVPYRPTAAELAEFGTQRERFEGATIYRPGGCEQCRGTGYLGRVGLYELLAVDEVIEGLVMQRAASSEIKEAAMRNGMTTLRDEGWQKVLEGMTSIEEVTRVTHEDEARLGVGEDDARHAD
ncbi:MAG: type II secretion system ATPase GspE [Fimbriimonadaceae bacterium]|nr:type II secretion system ATPase GspE [Fimbriimonadaceae bacterium]